MRLRAALLPLFLVLQGEPQARAVDEAAVEAGPYGSLLVTEPAALMALEARGFSMGAVFGAKGESGRALGASPIYGAIADTLENDVRELDANDSVRKDVTAPNHPFDTAWLRGERTHFELIAVVNRLDRRFADPSRCGEARLVYRLALSPEDRPTTRLPMTVNVMFPQVGDCAEIAARWLGLPERGAARVDALAALLTGARPFEEVEIDLQNLHGPSLKRDEDDHAEYLLRAFRVNGRAAAPKRLFNTPRVDLDDAARAELRGWIAQNFREIDAGTAVVPERFLAERIVSLTPRGLARPRNRTYRRMFEPGELAELPYADAKQIKSPLALLRYLDEGTCQGCHQSRSIAGFHLLGEERDASAFNALAVGRSVHLLEELAWRDGLLHATVAGAPYPTPRPFAEHGRDTGGYGARCGVGDPGFAPWKCAPGFRCRNSSHDEIGQCVPVGANGPGDACENATVEPRDGPDGDRIVPKVAERCLGPGGTPASDAVSCSPNGFGFPGGLCSDACTSLGAYDVHTDTICADLPKSGFESDCFATQEPIEECLTRHVVRRLVRACSADTPCRDDYGCARVAGAPAGRGACVPPYFVFQARVDGPKLDR
jgi:hypothetical protein